MTIRRQGKEITGIPFLGTNNNYKLDTYRNAVEAVGLKSLEFRQLLLDDFFGVKTLWLCHFSDCIKVKFQVVFNTIYLQPLFQFLAN